MLKEINACSQNLLRREGAASNYWLGSSDEVTWSLATLFAIVWKWPSFRTAHNIQGCRLNMLPQSPQSFIDSQERKKTVTHVHTQPKTCALQVVMFVVLATVIRIWFLTVLWLTCSKSEFCSSVPTSVVVIFFFFFLKIELTKFIA